MEQWEYKLKFIYLDEKTESPRGFVLWGHQIEEQLNEMGEQGWEIVCFPYEILKNNSQGYALFKRRKIKE